MSRTDKKPDEARRWEGAYVEAHIRADVFWLELGHLRRLLAQVEELPDKAAVTFEGRTGSLRTDEFYVKQAHVRHQEPTR